jgi:hypothetical protein
MTRKHFKAIAEALCDCRPGRENVEMQILWSMIVAKLSSVLSDSNKNFDREKFRLHCHYVDGKEPI